MTLRPQNEGTVAVPRNALIDVADYLNDAAGLVAALQAVEFDDCNERAAHGIQQMLVVLADCLDAAKAALSDD